MTTAKEAAEMMSNFVNKMGHDNKEFVEEMSREHRTLQQSFTGVCLAWIKYMAETDRIDGRNEYSQKVCKKLLTNVEDWELKVPLI